MSPRRMLLTLLLAALAFPAAADDLEAAFTAPPDNTKLRCYWYWMDGHISKEGLTKDLEAMRDFGIGEAYIGIISGQSGLDPKPEPPALSDGWWDAIVHAFREGSRLGVDLGFFNSPGWSQSGGPWVTPDMAMRHVSLPETRLTGPQRFEGKLPAPEGPFQDIAVLAYPAPQGEGVAAPEKSRTPHAVDFECPVPFTARSVTVTPVKEVNVQAELLASDDGKDFRPVKAFAVDRHNLNVNVGPVPLAPVVASFPAVTARYFRLAFSADCEVGEVRVSPAARVESHAEKALSKMFQDPLPPFDFYTWPPQAEPDAPGLAVAPDAVLNLSAKMDADGTLRWDVPAGEWIIQRAVMSPTGTMNSPSPEEATGLEVDKMNRAPLAVHFDAYIGDLLRRLTPEERRAFKHVVADSYEMGPQNWTDGFAELFQARYGYDPLPWLPALSGRVVGGADQTDRFLWDLRRLVADRVSTEYVGGLRDLCNAQGLKMWLENYGHWGYPGEFLQYGGQCDEISGEFWVNGDLGSVELRDAASCAHIYGKNVVWAEAFTGGIPFANSPRDLKARGDWAFSEGINQFVLHLVIHQPWDDKRPGVNAWFGTEFNRHNTWHDHAGPWVDYLRRCTVLLQRGLPVADAAYFIGEDAPKMAGVRRPELPAGHDYDYINAEVIETRLSVKDGRFVLPDGVSYGILVLPPSETMRPGLLKKIGELAAAGGAVFGPAPLRSPSLENYPACDDEVKRLAADLWGGGRILTGDTLDAAFEKLGLTPDLVCPADMLWKHRRDGDTDIYFVSNQKDAARDETLSFRVDGKAPELWCAETGRITAEPPYTAANGRVEMPVHFDAHSSVFVVFRKPAAGGGRPAPAPKAPKVLAALDGPWTVAFPFGEETFKTLASWTESRNEDVKYFSGEAVYRAEFKADETKGVRLDLGAVHDTAVVRVNGKELGTLWKEPYRLDISAALRPGKNEVEITVVNPWINRLIGDNRSKAEDRATFTSTNIVKPGARLKPAGLLGPVRVLAE